MPVVRVVILALDRVRWNVVGDGQGRSDGILRRERVACAETNVRAPGLQRKREIRRLRSDVEAGRKHESFERLLLRKALLNHASDRHLAGRPCDQLDAFIHESGVFDIP